MRKKIRRLRHLSMDPWKVRNFNDFLWNTDFFEIFFRTRNLTYSTCSSDPRTCPDGVCDSLERLSSAICPQDCMPKKNILMGGFHLENEKHGLGFGKVKRPNMICTCQGQSCSCIHQKLSHSVIEEQEGRKGQISTTLMLHPDRKSFFQGPHSLTSAIVPFYD